MSRHGSGHHRVGHRRYPTAVVTNADLEARLDTSDEWIVTRSGIRERHIGGTVSSLAIEAGAPGARARRAGPRPGGPARPGHVHPRPGRAGHLGGRAPRPRPVRRGLRRQRGVRRVRLRHGGGARRDQRRRRPGGSCSSAPTACRFSPTPTTAATAVLFADGAGAVVLEASDEDGLLAVDLGDRRQRARPPDLRPRRLHGHGGQRGLPARRAHHRRVGLERARAGQAHARRHRPVRPPPGQPAHHRSGRVASRHPHGPRRRGRRPHGQHLERLGPPGPRRRRRRRAAAARGQRPHVGVRGRAWRGPAPWCAGSPTRRRVRLQGPAPRR